MRRLTIVLVALLTLAAPGVATAAETCEFGRYFYSHARAQHTPSQADYSATVHYDGFSVSGSNDHTLVAWTLQNQENSHYIELGVVVGAIPPGTFSEYTLFSRLYSPIGDLIRTHGTVTAPGPVKFTIKRAKNAHSFDAFINDSIEITRNFRIPGTKWVTGFGEDANFTVGDSTCDPFDGYMVTNLRAEYTYSRGDHPFGVCFSNGANDPRYAWELWMTPLTRLFAADCAHTVTGDGATTTTAFNAAPRQAAGPPLVGLPPGSP